MHLQPVKVKINENGGMNNDVLEVWNNVNIFRTAISTISVSSGMRKSINQMIDF